MGLTFLLLAIARSDAWPAAARARARRDACWARWSWAACCIVVPWLVRQQRRSAARPRRQALENMFLLRNEQIFAIHDQPTLAGWLGQGVGAISSRPVRAMGSQLTDTIAGRRLPGRRRGHPVGHPAAPAPVPAAPDGARGAAPERCPHLPRHGLLFPVATLWGTFLHASGPLLVGLIVASVLGVDAGMTRVSRWRGLGPRSTSSSGPVALLALAIPVALVQLASVADSAAHHGATPGRGPGRAGHGRRAIRRRRS